VGPKACLDAGKQNITEKLSYIHVPSEIRIHDSGDRVLQD